MSKHFELCIHKNPQCLRIECAQNCKSCNIKGAAKCDPEQCQAGYVYNFATQLCDGDVISVHSIHDSNGRPSANNHLDNSKLETDFPTFSVTYWPAAARHLKLGVAVRNRCLRYFVKIQLCYICVLSDVSSEIEHIVAL